MIFNLVFGFLGVGLLGLITTLINAVIKINKNKKAFSFISIITLIFFSIIMFMGVFIGIDDLRDTNITENIISKFASKKSTNIADTSESTPTELSETSTEKNNESTTTISTQSNQELLNQIEIKVDFQDIIDNKKKIVVYITNNCDTESFTGTVSLETFDNNKNFSGGDTIYVENLAPTQYTYAIIWVNPTAISSTSSIKGDFTEVLSLDSNLNYEVVNSIGGNGNLRLFIVLDDLSINNLEVISKELKQKYTNDVVTLLDAYFYSRTDEVLAKNATFPEYELITYTLNYRSNESELSVPYIDNELEELLFERIPI